MPFYSDDWGLAPGMPSAAVETYESTFMWGPAGQHLITGGTINAAAIDSGNSPTSTLRVGLLLGQKTVDGTWTNYSPTATDGSEVAAGVLLTMLRMANIATGATQSRFYGILVGGPVRASQLLGLDLYARACMSDHFWFDDAGNFPGNHWFPWRRFQTKTANYTVLAGDNFTCFDNTGAGGAVTYTLPAIAPGYSFGFRGMVAQTWAVTSTEGTNVVALNNASASTITFSTGGQQIGSALRVYSNPAGTKWLVENCSAGAAAGTVS